MNLLEVIVIDSNSQNIISDLNLVIEKSINVYELFILEFIKYIDTINKLTITYLDDAIFNSHQNIFNIYKDNKY
jgi:hypothetical protein